MSEILRDLNSTNSTIIVYQPHKPLFSTSELLRYAIGAKNNKITQVILAATFSKPELSKMCYKSLTLLNYLDIRG